MSGKSYWTSLLCSLVFLGLFALGEQQASGQEEEVPGMKISGFVRSRHHVPISGVRLYIVNTETGRYISPIEGSDLTEPDGSFYVKIRPTSHPIIIDFVPPQGTSFAPSSLRLLGGEPSQQAVRKVLPSSDEWSPTRAARATAPATEEAQAPAEEPQASERELGEPLSSSNMIGREYSTLLTFEEYYIRALSDGTVDVVEKYRFGVIEDYLGKIGVAVAREPACGGIPRSAAEQSLANRFREKLGDVAGMYHVCLPRCTPPPPCWGGAVIIHPHPARCGVIRGSCGR